VRSTRTVTSEARAQPSGANCKSAESDFSEFIKSSKSRLFAKLLRGTRGAMELLVFLEELSPDCHGKTGKRSLGTCSKSGSRVESARFVLLTLIDNLS